MGIFSRRKYVGPERFQNLVNTLANSLETLREEFIIGSLSQLKREGIVVSTIPREILPGSELEDMLKGYQLTSMIGTAWDYINDARAEIDFDNMLSSLMNANEGSRARNYREKYVDCQGQIDALSEMLACDVHSVIGYPEPRHKYLAQFQGGANMLTWMCQKDTCSACGDDKKARELMEHMKAMLR